MKYQRLAPIAFLLLIQMMLLPLTAGAVDLSKKYSKSNPLTFGLDLDYPPLEYIDKNGVPRGCDVLFTRELMKRMNIYFTYQPNTWENISGDVIHGRVDLGMMVYSPYRKDIVNYSRAVFRLYYQAVYRKDEHGYFDMRNLKGKEIAYMASRPVTDTLRKAGAHLNVVRDLDKAIRDLSNGKYDAVICFRYQAKYFIATNHYTNLLTEDLTLTPREYCYVSKDKELISEINKHLVKMQADGTVDEIYDVATRFDAIKIPQWIWYFIFSIIVVSLSVVIVLQVYHSRRLRVKMLRAKRSERLKTILLGNVSHALRTPLNAIIGFSDVLKANDDGQSMSQEERMMLYNQINSNGQQLFHFINELLLLSNIEANQHEFSIERCDLAQLMADLEQEIAPMVEPEVDLRIQQTPIFVNIDPNLIRTVLVHFLNNAVQHTKKGHVELNYWKQDNGVYVEVKDTGTGLPESLKENIFALLSDENTYIQSKNPGLGLSICRAIIHLCNGKVGAKSQTGEGCTFWFWIPQNVD